MDKRYQVFVSSTYEDLIEERQEVMQALLELDCIPSGMELFPAANEDQWSLIKKVIDDCDYYMVIIGGRYGTVGPSGISYTEMEYRYAVDSGKPVIGFMHKNPEEISAKKTEKTEDSKKLLEDFRDLVGGKVCQFWTNPSDLGSKVSRSLVKLIKSHPATGWIRADLLPSEDITKEILELRKQVDHLKSELEATKVQAPAGTEGLSQGEDLLHFKYTFNVYSGAYNLTPTTYSRSCTLSWNEIFYCISPLMIDEATDTELKNALNTKIAEQEYRYLVADPDFEDHPIRDFRIRDEDFQTIKVQFRALSLIGKSIKPRSIKDTSTYWSLTPYGDTVMTRLRAIKK